MSDLPLREDQLSGLREKGILSEKEIAYKAGDLVIAENPVSGEKRVLGKVTSLLVESNKRILKG